MNQSAAKATRREIRRAFGPQAVHAISETHQNMQATVQSVAFVHERLDALEAKLGAERTHRLQLAEEQRSYVDAADRHGYGQLRAFRDRSFWGRLKWLLTGR